MPQIEETSPDMEVQAIEAGDFEWIVRQNQKRIYRILLFLVQDADAAENLTQECFLRAFRKIGSFRGESNLSVWLMRIAVNLAIDHRRNRRWIFWRGLRKTGQIEEIPVRDTCPTPERALLDKELLEKVQTAVDGLSERQRTAFMLRFLEDMSLDEIAGVTGSSVGTIKSHLFRAVRSVRKACGK